MRTQSFLHVGRTRKVIATMIAALAFSLPSFVQLSAQTAAPTKPAAQAATATSASAQPAKAAAAQPAKAGAAQTAPAKPTAAQAATAKPAAAAAKPAAAKALVDINHATVKELKTIPGIGDAYAAKIVAGRPYANKSQLLSKKVIASSLYETIQGMIIAKQ